MPTEFVEQFPQMKLLADQKFLVRLVNSSEHEAAVNLSLGGINSLWMVPGGQRYWIVPPRTTLDITGWQRRSTEVSPFQLANPFPRDIANGVALVPSDSLLISATFSSCWTNEAQRPPDEPLLNGRCITPGEFSVDIPGLGARTVGGVRDVLSTMLTIQIPIPAEKQHNE